MLLISEENIYLKKKKSAPCATWILHANSKLLLFYHNTWKLSDAYIRRQCTAIPILEVRYCITNAPNAFMVSHENSDTM